MRIAILIPTLDQIGGAERQVLLLARQFAAHGMTTTIIALSGTGQAVSEDLAQASVNFLSLDMRKAWIDPRGWLRYLRWARQYQPQILHAHLPHAAWFARFIRLLAPVPVVLDTLHTSRTASRGKRILYRLSRSLSDHNTCVSQSVADAAIAAGILRPGGFSILPNGVTLPPLRPSSISHGDIFQWLAIGRLSPVKDYPTLIRAFASLPVNQCQIPTLTIVGAGLEEQSLRQLVRTLTLQIPDLETRIHFAGFHPDVQPFLAYADAFVQASLWEGLPISILEAQAAALPIVVTNAPGVQEAMIVNTTGMLVPTGDVQALAAAMTAMMNMAPDLRQEMAHQGRIFVAQNFELSLVAHRWITLYDQLRSGKSAQASR